ncbi:restriction endonuclease [Acrocarpospora catenulata]|uniref:restriction endonuclease n=1 Tax=Acrocarpospora catenulata TaxID=2836182 RepID=UPI001BDB6C2C|nr:restriction endonuclease [Acrocarpospora catenulata]
MARKRGIWSDMQREWARRQRSEQQARRAALQAVARAERERARADRAAAQRAAANERERKRLYIESRKAEAVECAADVQVIVDELDSLLTAGLQKRDVVTFQSLKRTFQPPPFDPAGLDRPLPGRPQWVAPPPPNAVGRLFGGAARHEREEAAARQAYEQQSSRYEVADAERRRRLAERYHAYQEWISGLAREIEEHNTAVDEFESGARGGDSDAVAKFFTLVLDASSLPEAFPHRTRVVYRPEARELVVEYELPAQEVIPTTRDFRYVQASDEIKTLPRPPKEIKERYARLVAQVALRVLHEVFNAELSHLVETASFNGHVSAKDKATGQPIHPCLISAGVSRELFSTFVLADLDPVVCLKRINALVSPHPYELEAVRPMVDFEALLSQYKFVEGIDAVAGLDSRPDLLAMTPTEFEHLTRQLFEAMGMQSWVTQPSKDDGVDAVAVNEDPVFGGVCIIQAKRYSKAVGIESVRALAGVMEDKHATKGILVTTSWVGDESRAFAARHGRIQLIECEELVYLCKEHLGLDVLISLPKPPPRRR